MQNLITRLLTLLTLAVLLLGTLARAQFVEQIIRVKVPFEFTANQKVFPAGEYWFVLAAPDWLEVRDARGQVLASLVTHPVQSLESSTSTKLEFSTKGGDHRLTRLWTAGDSIGNELPASRGTTAGGRRSKPKAGATSGGGNQ